MPRRKTLTSRGLVQLLKKHGYVQHRQKGSQLYLIHPETRRIVVVPMHARNLPRGTVHSILKNAGIDP